MAVAQLARLTSAALLLAFCATAPAAGLLSAGREEGLLSVDEALSPQTALWRDGQLLLGWDVAAGCYLYRDKISVRVLTPAGYKLGTAQLPQGQWLQDAEFGKVRVLRGAVDLRFRPPAKQAPEVIEIRYQGCAENKVCYPPQTRRLTVQKVQ